MGEDAAQESDDEQLEEGSEHEQAEDEGAEDGGEAEKKPKRRRRKTAADMNLLRDPEDVIVELTEPVLQGDAAARTQHCAIALLPCLPPRTTAS